MRLPTRRRSSTWHTVRGAGNSGIENFLRRREYICVPITDWLRRRRSGAYVGSARFIVSGAPQDPTGLVFVTTYGFVYPVFGPAMRQAFRTASADQLGQDHGQDREAEHTERGSATRGTAEGREQLQALGEQLLKHSRFIYSVMGTERDVRIVENALEAAGVRSSTGVDYHLMVRNADPIEIDHAEPQSALSSLRVRRAGPADAERIYPLQRAYELEEVVLSPDHFDPAGCMHQLRQALRNQVVLVGETNGTPIAKAATNARGFAWDQIGGVYTARAYRGCGVARRLMQHLLAKLSTEGRRTSLFVKTNNPPACALYHRLHYREKHPFRITYYLGASGRSS